MPSPTLSERIRRRLADERGRIAKEAPLTVGLCYPSPYRVGMSSLGFQRIYRALMAAPGLGCERVFLDDECESDPARLPERPVTYESMRPIGELPVLAFSVAYELEIAGVVRMLQAAGIPPRRRDRDDGHPIVIAGGPLTFSNPAPLAAIVDAIVIGEGEARVVDVIRAIDGSPRANQLDALARLPHVFVPTHHQVLPPVGAADDALPSGPLGHLHAAHRTVGHVFDRNGARLLARLHVLRDAPVDQRRHANRSEGRRTRDDSRGGSSRGPRGGRRERSPRHRAYPPRPCRARVRSRPFVIAPRSAGKERRLRRSSLARRLSHADDRDGWDERTRSRIAGSPSAPEASLAMCRTCERSTAWTG